MIRTLTKGWYLCCYKYQRRNLNIYPNNYYRVGCLLFRGNSTTQFNHKKTNKQSKAGILIKTNEKSGNYFKQLMD